MDALVSEIQRLKYHRGFPYGNHLKCPVFLQDKYEYLAILQKHNMCNPDTMRIYPYLMIQPCMKNRKEYKVVYIPRKEI